MTAKEYLNQARHLDALINCRLREIDYWRDLSSSVSGTRFDGMPHSPNRPTEAPFVGCLEKIDEIQRSVEEKITYLVRLKEEINTASGEKKRALYEQISWKTVTNSWYSVTATLTTVLGRRSPGC